MRHILSASQFDLDFIEQVKNDATHMEKMHRNDGLKFLPGHTLACVFYEPSTRTSASFIAAMGRLGGTVIPITQGVQFSSVSKGETLEDTVVTLGQYADAIVLRHPETGAVARAAQVSPVPVINAGDGIGEHPTQALLDIVTIHREVGLFGGGMYDGLTVAFVGDLKHGRTIHSLAKLLALYKATLLLVAPPQLSLPGDMVEDLQAKGCTVRTATLEEAVQEAGVVYMTRVQKERFSGESDAPFILTPELMAGMKKTTRIMHPLPRLAEIPTSIDADPRAAYFRQVRTGLYVRMALLMWALRG